MLYSRRLPRTTLKPTDRQSIYNEDANQWTWTPEVGVEREVLGPFDTIQVREEKNKLGVSSYGNELFLCYYY